MNALRPPRPNTGITVGAVRVIASGWNAGLVVRIVRIPPPIETLWPIVVVLPLGPNMGEGRPFLVRVSYLEQLDDHEIVTMTIGWHPRNCSRPRTYLVTRKEWATILRAYRIEKAGRATRAEARLTAQVIADGMER